MLSLLLAGTFLSAANAGNDFVVDLGRHALDTIVLSDEQAFACYLAKDSSGDAEVYLAEISLPEGVVSTPLLLGTYQNFVGPAVVGCDLEFTSDLTHAIVMHDLSTNSTNSRRTYRSLVNLSTQNIETVEMQLSNAVSEGTSVEITRVGTSYYLVNEARLSRKARVFSYFDESTFLDNAPPDLGTAAAIFLDKKFHANYPNGIGSTSGLVINNGQPQFVHMLFTANPVNGGTANGFNQIVFESDVEVLNEGERIQHSRIYAYDDGTLGTGQRSFIDRYYNAATDETVQIGLWGQWSFIPNYRIMHHVLGDHADRNEILNKPLGEPLDPEDVYEVPTTMFVLLHEDTDWVIASRNLTTSKLDIQRFEAAYTAAVGQPILPSAFAVDSDFCGIETPIDNDAIHMDTTPAGLLVVTHFTCPGGEGVDNALVARVIDSEFPDADLQVSVDDGGITSIVAGESINYTIVANNVGPDANNHASFDVLFPVQMSCDWSSVANGGATGNTTTDSGNIDESLQLPSGSNVVYTANCSIEEGPAANVMSTAIISSPSIDLNDLDNIASDGVMILDFDVIYKDGFEEQEN